MTKSPNINVCDNENGKWTLIRCKLAFTLTRFFSYSLNMTIRAGRRQHTRVPPSPLVMEWWLSNLIYKIKGKRKCVCVCVTVYVETASVHQKLKGSILKIRTRGGGSGLPWSTASKATETAKAVFTGHLVHLHPLRLPSLQIKWRPWWACHLWTIGSSPKSPLL